MKWFSTPQAMVVTFVLGIGSQGVGQERTPWQMHPGGGVKTLPQKMPYHGWEKAYRLARAPRPDDPGWRMAPNAETVGYSVPSALPRHLGNQVNFTWFQCYLGMPSLGQTVKLRARGIDSGARIMIQNSRFPKGHTLAYLRKDSGPLKLFGEAVIDLTFHLAVGINRIVLVHCDDAGPVSSLRFARIEMGGSTIVCRKEVGEVSIRFIQIIRVVEERLEEKRLARIEWQEKKARYQVLQRQLAIQRVIQYRMALINRRVPTYTRGTGTTTRTVVRTVRVVRVR